MATIPIPTNEPSRKPWETDRGRALQRLLNECRQDVQQEKWLQIQTLKRNHFYRHGIQSLVKAKRFAGTAGDATYWEYMPTQEALEQSFRSKKHEDQRRAAMIRDYPLNIYREGGKAFESVIGAQLPTLTGQPDRRGDVRGINRGAGAEALWMHLSAKNEVASKHSLIASTLYYSGSALVHTPYVANGKKHGYYEHIPQVESEQPMVDPMTSEPVIDPMTGEPVMEPVLVDGEPEYFPRGMAEMRVYDGFKVTAPFDCSDISDCPWLLLEYEVHKATLFEVFPEIIDDFKGQDSEGNTGTRVHDARDAQRMRTSPTWHTPYPRRDRLMYGQLWLRPGMFFLIGNDEEQNGMLDEYPEGCKITYVNGTPVKWEASKMDDEWVVIKPESEDALWQDSVGHDLIPGQDQVNNIKAKLDTLIDKMSPKTLIDNEVLDPEAMQRNGTMEVIPVSLPQGKSLGDVTRLLSQAQVPADMVNVIQIFTGLYHKSVGLHEGLWAGGSADTATGANIQNNAALRQFNVLWDATRRGTERYATNLVMQFARNSVDRQFQTDDGTAWDLDEIAQGGWHFESEPGMPQTTGQIRDFIMAILQSLTPEIAQITGIDNPAGRKVLQGYVGIPGIPNPGADTQVAIQNVISKIMALSEEEVEQLQVMGGLEQVAPFDPFEFPPDMVVNIGKNWLVSREGQTAKDAKPIQRQIVRGWIQQYDLYLQQQQMMMAQAQAGGIPPGEAPPNEQGIPPTAPPPDAMGAEQPLAQPDYIANEMQQEQIGNVTVA